MASDAASTRSEGSSETISAWPARRADGRVERRGEVFSEMPDPALLAVQVDDVLAALGSLDVL
ncbi:MAG TPA: hypothetical protein VLS51_04180 [Propionibacteriaceae bacterium]|nr:hypothetical protein [Propionibacteriaceae bacterium]